MCKVCYECFFFLKRPDPTSSIHRILIIFLRMESAGFPSAFNSARVFSRMDILPSTPWHKQKVIGPTQLTHRAHLLNTNKSTYFKQRCIRHHSIFFFVHERKHILEDKIKLNIVIASLKRGFHVHASMLVARRLAKEPVFFCMSVLLCVK